MSAVRVLISFIVGFVVTSQLNWLIAERWLNPYVTPMFDGFMRTGSGINLPGIIIGMVLPVAVVTVILVLMREPQRWWARGLVAGALVSVTTFFGAYSFLSGWGNVPMRPLMITAVADTISVLVGALVIAGIQKVGTQRRSASA